MLGCVRANGSCHFSTGGVVLDLGGQVLLGPEAWQLGQVAPLLYLAAPLSLTLILCPPAMPTGTGLETDPGLKLARKVVFPRSRWGN